MSHRLKSQSLLCLLVTLYVRKGCVLALLASFVARFQSLVLSDKRFVFASSLLCFLQRSACLLKVWVLSCFPRELKARLDFLFFSCFFPSCYLLEHDSKPHWPWLLDSYLGPIYHPSLSMVIPNDHPGSVQLTHISSTDQSLVKSLLHFWKRAERGPGSQAKI